jgi:MFS family permease
MDDWRRTARVLWVVQFLTTAALNLGLTFIPFVLRDDPVLGAADEATRTLYIGLILAGPFVSTILFTPLWGWVADRTGPKRQVVRACLGLGLTQLLMAAARTPGQMVAVRVLQGVVSGVLAACLGLASAVTPREHQGRALALVHSATPAGQVLGPLAGGLLAAALGFRGTYALLGSLIVLTGLLSWLLLDGKGFTPTASANPFAGLYRAGRRALALPALRQAFGLLVAGQFAFTVAQGVFAIYAGKLIAAWVERTGAAPAWWNSGVGFTAVAFAVTALANAACSPWWGRLHDRGVPLLTPLGAAVLALALLVLAGWPAWWVVLLARAGVGAGVGATGTLPFAVISSGAGPRERGQLMGLATALTQVGNLAGFLLGGVLAGWWSEAGNFALAAGVYAGVVAAGAALEWRRRAAGPCRSRAEESGLLAHRNGGARKRAGRAGPVPSWP